MYLYIAGFTMEMVLRGDIKLKHIFCITFHFWEIVQINVPYGMYSLS